MYFDFTPDPRVLLALTENPMKPLDALCELIDNSLDSFSDAKKLGIDIPSPFVEIELPKKMEIDSGVGFLRVSDNGPGMTPTDAEKSIKAGYSGNNPYDSLGLFGMGFNISTGKLGNRTKLITATPTSDIYIQAEINLREINENKNYSIEAEELNKAIDTPFKEGESGTIVEVSDWWPKGNSNHGFVSKLIGFGRPLIRKEIGRRYASYLRAGSVRIIVDGVECDPYYFCVWDSKRFVTRRGTQIPARYDFSKVLATFRRCSDCKAVVPDNASECPYCGCKSFRTEEEKVEGWVGIQRFDSSTDFGIDLIRNGRAIRKFEKEAFFTYTDELGEETLDYPIDGPFGRIVGEVHIDFVPVDFMKQDFNRTSSEWNRAMTFLRGDSSLQPNKPGASENTSPVYLLYQGYRKVRIPGRTDMYMGFWDAEEKKPKRISREKEKEYYRKFQEKEPGYFDDAEWWRLVEEADQPPAPTFVVCPDCGAQNPQGAEECQVCGRILIGKPCINSECGKTIPRSASVCPHCGESQVPKVLVPWICEVCGAKNNASDEYCLACGEPKGRTNPISESFLLEHSKKDDDLSSEALSVKMADGSLAHPMKLSVYVTDDKMVDPLVGTDIPLMIFKSTFGANVFIDKSHRLYSTLGVPPEEVISSEMALTIYDETRSNLSKYRSHNLTNIAWRVLEEQWGDELSLSSAKVADDASAILDDILHRLAQTLGSEAMDYEKELTEDQRRSMTDAMMRSSISIDRIQSLHDSGGFLAFVPHGFILSLLALAPSAFFNGGVWKVGHKESAGMLDESVLLKAEESEKQQYCRCLECVIEFENDPTPDPDLLRMAHYACLYLSKGMAF